MTVINAQARAELEAAIDARINSGVKAASYSTDEQAVLSSTMQEGSVVERVAGTGSHLVGCTADGSDDEDCACPPQKPDKVSDKACNDAARLRVALAVIASLEADYQPQHRGKTPGIGRCPTGKCEDCWDAGFEVTAAAKRYRNLCRRRAADTFQITGDRLTLRCSCGWEVVGWSDLTVADLTSMWQQHLRPPSEPSPT